MKEIFIIDTGPLVAYLKRDDKNHEWAVKNLADLSCPLLTCEAVISEACFLLRHIHQGQKNIFELLQRGLLKINFDLSMEVKTVNLLMQRYQNVPMSFADACLVRMSELHTPSTIITLDTNFKIYRRNGRQIISLMT